MIPHLIRRPEIAVRARREWFKLRVSVQDVALGVPVAVLDLGHWLDVRVWVEGLPDCPGAVHHATEL